MKSNLAIVCRKYLRYLAPLFALAGVLALPVGAQVNTASLTGQVADANGGAAKGATVTAKNNATNGALTAGSTGEARAATLPPSQRGGKMTALNRWAF